ncbi:glycoprotein-N-acetylgalactosamine 3-beta-galactosyltransferase 1-like isoform X3 [Varroa jacobsoni]|uniref:glycoprotein-N-acetylgalactosamine 3-beta-galactosyltransferase 1-like isoform X3 n=1 Tax=Varroa jacobsoni TaxID=62625 RepID=UPI000BF8EC21|nr:glycoprotein-N-acetylgalactosamine 3-beta-galactosyltransferase 1-like isoform X3 [Varroa jacobsoni]
MQSLLRTIIAWRNGAAESSYRTKMIQIKDVAYSRWRPPIRGTLPSFIIGTVVGFSMAMFIIMVMEKPMQPISYGRFLQLQQAMLQHQNGPHHDDYEDAELLPGEDVKTQNFHDHKQTYSDDLSEKVRVLCWVMTNPKTHSSKARHVQLTWGKRCNILLFMSSQKDNNLTNVVALKMDAEDREHLWQKTKLAFEYVHKHYRDMADWFLKADDDTYVIVENLRYFLSRQNTTNPVYFGHKFKRHVKEGYMSGGAGYVLSKEALDRFAEGHKDACRKDPGGAEDVNMGECLAKLGVEAGNSRDQFGGERFLPLSAPAHLTDGLPSWFWSYTAYKQNGGEKSISDSVISFHYTESTMMHVIDFMLYHIRPYGVYAWYEKEQIKNEPNRPFDKESY